MKFFFSLENLAGPNCLYHTACVSLYDKELWSCDADKPCSLLAYGPFSDEYLNLIS